MLNENGKIGVGILAAVLITTAIIVPVSIFADRAIRGAGSSAPVVTAGYDDGITSTGKRQDGWMNIDENETTGTMDGTLIQNENYNSVADSETMIDIIKSEDGVGYLSLAEVNKYDELKALDISEDQGETWIDPTSSDYIAAPLNMVMKVPSSIAEVLKKSVPSVGSTPITIADLDAAETGYGTWLKDNDLMNQFAMGFIIFAWVAESDSAHKALQEANFSTPNIESVSDEEFATWAATVFADKDWGVVDGKGFAPTSIEVNVDGTGTDEFALNEAIGAFNEAYGVSVIQNLNNGGSYRAWETAEEAKVPPGVTYNEDEYDGESNGNAAAFIGTQSRGMETDAMADPDGKYDFDKGEISYWGYDESKYTGTTFGSADTSDLENIIYDYNAFVTTEGVPLATTIAGDNIVFYTTDDAQFELNDGTVVTPTGLTQEGAKALFQYGASWNSLLAFDAVEYEEV